MNWIRQAKEAGWRFCCGVDLSGSGRAGNVIFTGAVNSAQEKVPLDIRCGKWTSPELARQLDAVDQLYSPEILLVENNGYQQAFKDWARVDLYQHPWVGRVQSFTTGKNKVDRKHGLPGLEIEFENGIWKIPQKEFQDHGLICDRGKNGGSCEWCRWVDEMSNYPHVGNDDTVMACWFFREACRRICFQTDYKKGRRRISIDELRNF